MTNRAGAGVDSEGRPVLDPTKNVLDLVRAETKRQDDLAALRAHYEERMDRQRAAFNKEIRMSESERIDAIRAVDVGAVQRAAEVQATQAQALATQVVASAEALRTQVQAAAAAAQTALTQALEPIQKDIQDLRKAQYEAQGKTTGAVDIRGVMFAVVGFLVAAVAVVVAIIQ